MPTGARQSAIRNQESVRSVRSDSDVALTVDGQITGTPAYMPPEQAEGRLEQIDHRSDVYSLGAILYEILTLERPIEGQTIHQVLLNVADGKITPPEQRTPGRHIPKELSAIVMKAMAKNRRKRYQSVRELGQVIKRFLEGRSVSAKEDTFVETFSKLVKRNKGISLAVGLNFQNTQVSDLAPRRGMPLEALIVSPTMVADLTPLQGMNLKVLWFTPKNIVKGIEVVRQMESFSVSVSGARIASSGPRRSSGRSTTRGSTNDIPGQAQAVIYFQNQG